MSYRGMILSTPKPQLTVMWQSEDPKDIDNISTKCGGNSSSGAQEHLIPNIGFEHPYPVSNYMQICYYNI